MSYIKNLICNKGNFELNIPEFNWEENKITVLTGPSGSGKSTFVESLCGLVSVNPSFEWIYKNKNLALLDPPKRGISLMFQSLELFLLMNAEQNILFPAEAQKRPPEETKTRFIMLQKYLQLSSFLKKPVHLLSGGEKQRVALARALISKSMFLILDEPFASLDNSLKESAMILLKKILEQDGCSILVISHNKEEIAFLSQKIFYINKGRLTSALVDC